MDALESVAQNDICSLRIICTLAQQKNANFDLEKVDCYGNTALLKACYLGKYEAAKTLLLFGANINAINYFGQNCLTLATFAGSLDLVRELLKHRSYEDFNLSSMVPAHCVAVMYGHRELINFYSGLEPNSAELSTCHGLTVADFHKLFDQKQKTTINKKYML